MVKFRESKLKIQMIQLFISATLVLTNTCQEVYKQFFKEKHLRKNIEMQTAQRTFHNVTSYGRRPRNKTYIAFWH